MRQNHIVRTDLLACPYCLEPLYYEYGTLGCAGCDRSFAIKDEIPCFAPPHDFYDAYAEEHCPYAVSPSGLKAVILRFLPFWSWREWQFWRHAVPRCNRLLDIGCGRGRQIFVERSSERVGFDGSVRFARDCTAHYDCVAVGRLPHLPFRSEIFDAVVSSHVIGHIPMEQKETLVREIARLVRPGGTTAHIIETDSNHPVVVAAKKYPETYHKQFIEQDGHVGLELAPRVLERFTRYGFRITGLRLVDAIIPSLQNFRKYLNHPDFGDLPGISELRRIDKWTRKNRTLTAVYEVGMGIFHRTVEQWMGRPERAQFILVSMIKTTKTEP